MINNVTLMGRLTTQPELKTSQNNKSVTSFHIAVDRRYQPQGEEKKTDFPPCVAWNKNAEFISKWFHKGDMIGIVGEIQTRNFEDKQGNKRTAVEIVVNQVSFCGGKKDNAPANTTPENVDITPEDDDLPF